MYKWIFVFFGLLGLVGNTRGEEVPFVLLGEKVPVVLVSVAPHQFLVDQIAQFSVRPILMVPAGASSHSYEPTPRQMLEALLAKVWLGIGEPFEAKAVAAIQQHRPNFRWVDLREGLDLLFTDKCSCHKGADPHIWLSLRLLAQQAKAIYAQLVQLRPEMSSIYEARLQMVLDQIAKTDHEISFALQHLRGSVLAVSHPAYGYFCRDYGLLQIAIEQEGRDPTMKQIQQLLHLLSQHKVSHIFTQPQYSDKAARLLAEQLPAKQISLDPYTPNTLSFLTELAHVLSSP